MPLNHTSATDLARDSLSFLIRARSVVAKFIAKQQISKQVQKEYAKTETPMYSGSKPS
jgi:hypothetical protein